jgi:caffeoyl-CoA O-methyltransferase
MPPNGVFKNGCKKMNVNDPFARLESYLDSLVQPRPPEMQSMETYAQKTGFPIVGPASGQFCYLIARLIGAKQIFEMGSGYGYSTAWFARAIQENGGGSVHHVVWDETLSRKAKDHLTALGYGDIVRYQVSEAVQALRDTSGPFDLIFNDIDKHAYPEALPVIHQKLRSGGVLIVDNLLWHGQVLDPSDTARDTLAIREFTRLITTSPDWTASLVPIRDGLMVAYKK